MIQTPPGLDNSQRPETPGVVNWSPVDMQRRIDENATLAVSRFEGPGICPHCRQTVFRPWRIQLGNPPIDLHFCNAAIVELKALLEQIRDPRKG